MLPLQRLLPPLSGRGDGREGLRSPRWQLAVLLAAVSTLAAEQADVMLSKVWMDRRLFNMTLKTTTLDGLKRFAVVEEKARAAGLDWPLSRQPTLCFLGLGPNSADSLLAFASLFPDLKIVLMDVEDRTLIADLPDLLGPDGSRVSLGEVGDFSPAHRDERQSCQAVFWSVDAPTFTYHRYRDLFNSSSEILAMLSFEGCLPEPGPGNKHKCEFMHSSYLHSFCGMVDENRNMSVAGNDVQVGFIDSACAELYCLCHARSTYFWDIHYDEICWTGEDGKPQFMGQWAQDEFILGNFFSVHGKKGTGIYIDVGASQPFHLSNTAYFDQCLGWRGVCLEPNPRNQLLLESARSCQVLSACAWSNETVLRFTDEAELAQRYDGLEPSDEKETFEAHCAPLHDLLLDSLPLIVGSEELAAWRGGEKPVIDLLSVDAEGAEIDIFRDFPFDQWDIRVIVVETSRETATAIDSLLMPQGLMKVAVLGKDAVYASWDAVKDMPAGGPVLPKHIMWNEPGTDADTIDYRRFQRLFGATGDLDVEVGDQRLLNETELERQRERQAEGMNALKDFVESFGQTDGTEKTAKAL